MTKLSTIAEVLTKTEYTKPLDIAASIVTNLQRHGYRITRAPLHSNSKQNIPAAACTGCGGWTSHGGMSQHANPFVVVQDRTGCQCFERRERE